MIRFGLGFVIGVTVAAAAAQHPALSNALASIAHVASVLLEHLVAALGGGAQ